MSMRCGWISSGGLIERDARDQGGGWLEGTEVRGQKSAGAEGAAAAGVVQAVRQVNEDAGFATSYDARP